MGRRSRKRASESGSAAPGHGSTRAERDAARRDRARQARLAGDAEAPVSRPRPGRPSIEERPPPLWAPFPLTELVIFAGIVLMAWGFLTGAGDRGNAKIVAGLAIASIAGLELAIREHVTGFRSHTTLLSGAIAIAAVVALGLGASLNAFGALLAVGLMAFVASFLGLRQVFKRRSGGLSFR